MNPTTYSLSGYGQMIADTHRMDAYFRALQTVINPGSIILDIGAGSGICTLLACQLGAQKVYAIEPSDVIQIAQQIAQANGYSDRIEFIQAVSTEVNLPEPVDLIVSDLRGVLPLFQHHIPSLRDARQRFLAPNGVLIPQSDHLWATVIEDPDQYKVYTSPWSDAPYGLNMQVGQQFVTNTWGKATVKPDQFLTDPQCWATLDYRTLENPNIHADLHWTAPRSGIAHGLCLWFDATLIDGVTFSNAPGQPDLIYGKAFFPLSQPVELEFGDKISVQLKTNLIGNDYTWIWKTKVTGQRDPAITKADFQQSTFLGIPLSPKQLRKQGDQFIPKLNTAGKIDAFVLSLMDQGMSLGVIAQRLTDQFSDRFPTWKDAFTHVGQLSQQYSEG